VPRPAIELKGFTRVPLAPGASSRVVFELSTDLFGYIGLNMVRIVDAGEILVWIGLSSADRGLPVAILIEGPTRVVGRDRAWQARVVED
jgi:hypothetical protein